MWSAPKHCCILYTLYTVHLFSLSDRPTLQPPAAVCDQEADRWWCGDWSWCETQRTWWHPQEHWDVPSSWMDLEPVQRWETGWANLLATLERGVAWDGGGCFSMLLTLWSQAVFQYLSVCVHARNKPVVDHPFRRWWRGVGIPLILTDCLWHPCRGHHEGHGPVTIETKYHHSVHCIMAEASTDKLLGNYELSLITPTIIITCIACWQPESWNMYHIK